MPDCPDALARWLVAQGADVQATDRYKRNALHIAASRWRDPALLIELGCDIHAQAYDGDTPLHAAADSKKPVAVERLLAAGAEINATNREGLTPLEQALRGCSNIEIERMVSVARTLLAAGARRTPTMKDYVRSIGECFEFHRAGYVKDSVEATGAALIKLCKLFDVEPPERRIMHDEKAAITVKAGTWQRQHDELWNFLVPSRGAASTVQGEVIRITGRISGEIARNGGGNWDADFTAMARALLQHIRTGMPLEENEVGEAVAIVNDIVKRTGGGDHNSAPSWR